ncbi:LA_2272 family surface repeat-containing protein [Aeromonas veronii]
MTLSRLLLACSALTLCGVAQASTPVQVSLPGVNLTNNVQGLNWGAVNIAKGNALANVGFVNYAERTTFQIGFINATKHLDGLQIGLANYAANGVFPILPLVNFQKSF